MSIQRGQKSIGMSNAIPAPATLPPAADSSEEVITYLLDKVSAMETVLEGKADADRIRTLIAYSDEAVLIKAQDIILAGDVTFVDLVNEWNGTTSGEVPQSITRIVGDRIQTGTITSNNWGAAEGSAYDLNNGTITIGGSDNPAFVFDGTDLFVSGTITAEAIISQGTPVAGTGKTMGDIAAQEGMSEAELNQILEDGVGQILAGQGGDYLLEVGPTSLFARHKDFNENGTAAYSGTLRTAVFLGSNGIAMGYNQRSNGDFIPAVTIESNGDVVLRGTLTADSVIANTVIAAGQNVLTTVNRANAGNSHAGISGSNPHNTSMDQISGDLDDIADGSTFFKTNNLEKTGAGRAHTALDSSANYQRSISTQNITVSGANPTNGVVIDSDGLRGYGGGELKFEINASNGSATFSGEIMTSQRVAATGAFVYADGLTAAIHGVPDNPSNLDFIIGVYGRSNNSTGTGVWGFSQQNVGVRGNTETGRGGMFSATHGSGTGLLAQNTAGGRAIWMPNGYMDLQGPVYKSRASNNTIRIWDKSDGEFVGEYEFEFQAA